MRSYHKLYETFDSFLFAAALCCASCSDSPEAEPSITYLPTDIHGTTHGEVTGNYYGSVEGFYLVTVFNGTEACDLLQETYAWFDVRTSNELKFVGEHAQDGVLHITLDNIAIVNTDVTSGDLNLEQTYFQDLPIAASEEGTYEFALKFYQPGTGKYYITSYYSMVLWLENDRLLSKTTRMESHRIRKIDRSPWSFHLC